MSSLRILSLTVLPVMLLNVFRCVKSLEAKRSRLTSSQRSATIRQRPLFGGDSSAAAREVLDERG